MFNGMLNTTQLISYAMRALVMLIAIPFHEAAHAYASDKLGDPTAKQHGRLTLNPMAHFDLMGALCMIFVGIGWAKPVPTYANRFKNPRVGMAITAAAGPLSNLLLAYVSMLLYKLTYVGVALVKSSFYLAPNDFVFYLIMAFWQTMVALNIALAVFNCMPVPPFDGSRVAFLLLPRKWYFQVMRYERKIFMVMFVLLMIGVFDPILSLANGALWDALLWSTGFVEILLGFA